MRFRIAGGALPIALPFAKEINAVAIAQNVSAFLMYAIKANETGLSTDPAEMEIGAIGDKLPNGDNAGHGIFQLTSSWPRDWSDPYANAEYAAEVYIVPAMQFWANAEELAGDDLVRAIAAQFNAGKGGAIAGHDRGDVDDFTTNDYGARALAHYHNLLKEGTI